VAEITRTALREPLGTASREPFTHLERGHVWEVLFGELLRHHGAAGGGQLRAPRLLSAVEDPEHVGCVAALHALRFVGEYLEGPKVRTKVVIGQW
jgi:hypothetical protein